MDLSQIPKIFWHALSFAVVALTVGLLVFGYRSATISIEIANTKIGLNQAITETERLNSDLQKKAEVLQQAKAELQVQVEKMNEEIKKLNQQLADASSAPPKPIESTQVSVEAVEIPHDDFAKTKGYLDEIKKNVLDVGQYQIPKS